MLIEFRFKNFRSFKDEQFFSMVASADESLPQNVFDPQVLPNRKKLLTSAAVYGPNASGKSNLLKALAFVKMFVTRSDNNKVGGKIGVEPFLFSPERAAEPTEFELYFIQKGTRYCYRFKLDINGVLDEELSAYPKGSAQLWFARSTKPDWKPDFKQDGVSWKFGSNLKGKTKFLADATRPNVLFLTQAVKLNYQPLKLVYQWFEQMLQVLDVTEMGGNLQRITIAMSEKNSSLRTKLVSLLREADLGIEDFEVREEEPNFEEMSEEMSEEMPPPFRQLITEIHKQMKQDGAKPIAFYMRHSTDDPKNNLPLPFNEESFGTLNFFARSGPILYALEKGQVLVVDELDASLHPILLRNLINLFHNSELNQKGAQLIFNTHDTTLMDNSAFDEPLLRRDQFWLVEKGRDGASSLYSLWDFKAPRKEEALQKNYLEGRYGAIPVVDSLLQETAIRE